MANAQLITRFAIEVAPSQLSSIIRRRRGLPRMLDTITEEEKEAAMELSSSYALHAKAPQRNVIGHAREIVGSPVHAEKGKRCVAGSSSAAHGEKRLVLASAPAKAACSKIAV